MRLLTLLYLLLFSLPIIAQQKKIIVVNPQNERIQDASISLVDPTANKVLSQTKTDSMGIFNFLYPKLDSLEIQISHLQYQFYQEKFSSKDITNELIIELKPLAQEIEGIVVTGKTPQVVRKIDRLVFQVENSNISSLNGWDILKRTPLVKIQGSSVSVRGSQNIVILINDKRQMMGTDELMNLLEGTSGTEIQSIEVITNPPAKYEASGSTVINIKMKQNKSDGYKGSLFSKYEQSNYAKQLFSTTQNYKNEKFNIRGSYNFGRGTYARYGTDVVIYPNDQTRWESTLTRVDDSKNQQSYTGSMEYYIDSTFSILFNIDGSYQPNINGIYEVPTFIYNKDNIVESSYHTTNDHIRFRKSNNLFLQLSKKTKKGSQIDWSNYYSNSKRNDLQNILTHLNFKGQSSKNTEFTTDNNYDTQLYSSQIDINKELKSIDFDFGGKYSFVNSKNRMVFKDNELGDLEIRPEKSSNFDYEEQNIAAYLTGSYAYKKWEWKAGLRAEYSIIEGIVSQPKDINKSDYLTLFPTFYMQYQADNSAQWGFSYGKRINRPSYSWLNPAKPYYNQFSYFQGDPRLRATISHNFNLTYTHKNWVVDLFYNYERWPNMEISYQNNETNELVYNYTNIKNGQAAGLSINKNFDITSFWNIYVDLTGFYNDNIFMGRDQKEYKNKVFIYNSLARSSFILDKKNDWNLELQHQYFSKSIQGTFTISPFSSTSLIMNRKFLNKKLELSAYFLDIFKTEKTKISTKYADQNNYFLDYQDSRKFVITARFNFGNQSVKQSKNVNKTDEQKRL